MTDDALASLDSHELAAVVERHAEGLRATAAELSAEIESGSEPSVAQAGAVRTELEEFVGVVEAVVGDVEGGSVPSELGRSRRGAIDDGDSRAT